MLHCLRRAGILLGCATLLPTAVAAQGAIGGVVRDTSGAVLPGVTVALSNPGTIGGTQETVTDARGAYQFTRLVPGRYSVKATLTGFRSATQENVVVNADATARVDLQLEIGALEEGIIVRCQQSAAGGGSSPRTGGQSQPGAISGRQVHLG